MSYQGSGRCLHGGPPEITLHSTPSVRVETIPIAAAGAEVIILWQILLKLFDVPSRTAMKIDLKLVRLCRFFLKCQCDCVA